MLKYTKEHFGWEKFALIGHSMGAAIAIWYSSIFEEDVDRLISIDLVNVGPLNLEKHMKQTRKSIQNGVSTFKKLAKDSSKPVPSYEFLDAVAR